MIRSLAKRLLFNANLFFAKKLGLTDELRCSQELSKIDVSKYSKIVVLAPHPDDETIGCASILEESVKSSRTVEVVLVTGSDSRLDETRSAISEISSRDIRITFLGYKDGEVYRSQHDLEKSLIELFGNDIEDTCFFVPYIYDFHSDHIGSTIAFLRAFSSRTSLLNAYMYRTNHANIMEDFDSYLEVDCGLKTKMYNHFQSQGSLNFEALSSIRRIYKSYSKVKEVELFRRICAKDKFVDLTKLEYFEDIEGKVSDIHPIYFLRNSRKASSAVSDATDKGLGISYASS
ncbi:PIG-L deacetylase family protein [Ferrimonas balearica]|uniref:PIG-L deacetylase family protein n=1 Tax=Ferrimonas balearica TaxID=44012 RepID=UPI001C98FFFD|nr:PIG-L family deacetylase [Ferrimonas balearica]MBY5990772.1 PIG-L family deacetylase [Ferrimonas balearica]